MKIKRGVILPRNAITLHAMIAVDAIYMKNGRPEGVTITSGREGKHKIASKHYCDHAFDCRIFYFPDFATKKKVRDAIKRRLGKDFDVVLESTHIHVEFDPKTERNSKYEKPFLFNSAA